LYKLKGNEIKLVFDENIKLKNLNKQLLFHPNEIRTINLQLQAKTISIKIKDTFNLTQLIALILAKVSLIIMKEIPINQFKYVFYRILTLPLEKIVKDAYERN
jgi:hypothetical protein